MNMNLKDMACELSVNLNNHLFQVMLLHLLLPIWKCVTLEVPYPNFMEVLIFERPAMLVIPKWFTDQYLILIMF